METDLEERIEKGKFYFISGKYEYAIKEFTNALKIKPDSPELLYSLGIAYESSNDYEKARDSYLLALRHEPGHERAKEHLDRLLDK